MPIAQLGQPVLRQRAKELSDQAFSHPEFKKLIAEMKETLEESGGVGLAAPQVFAPVRVFLAAVLPPSAPDARRGVEVFVNPKLTFLSEEKASAWEGCLSFIELLVKTPRHVSLRVDYANEEGEPRALELHGFPARVVQHEYDHLDGILTLDRAASTLDIVKASEIDAVFGRDDETEEAGDDAE